MAAFDDEPSLGEKRKPLLAHQIGQNLDDLSAPELKERIGLLRAEIERLERAIEARRGDPRGGPTRHSRSDELRGAPRWRGQDRLCSLKMQLTLTDHE